MESEYLRIKREREEALLSAPGATVEKTYEKGFSPRELAESFMTEIAEVCMKHSGTIEVDFDFDMNPVNFVHIAGEKYMYQDLTSEFDRLKLGMSDSDVPVLGSGGDMNSGGSSC